MGPYRSADMVSAGATKSTHTKPQHTHTLTHSNTHTQARTHTGLHNKQQDGTPTGILVHIGIIYDTAAVRGVRCFILIDFVDHHLLGHDMVARQRHEPFAEQTTPGLDHVIASAAVAAFTAFTVALFPPF